MEKVYFSYSTDYDEVTAFFPEIKETKEYILCYAHIGQHSGAHPEHPLCDEERPATEKEYTPLLNELRSIGYNLTLITIEQYSQIIKGV